MTQWRDGWKLGLEGHAAVRALHERVRDEIRSRHQRTVPLADALTDRWEKADYLGFGAGTSIYDSSLVLGDVEVGEHTWIGPGTLLDGRGGLRIGSYCSISAGVHIYSHDTIAWALTGGRAREARSPTAIGDCCYLGPQAVVTRGVTIGDHSLVGALSVVKQDVPPYSVVGGIPARVLGRVAIGEDHELTICYD
ncbi:MAG: acyltransferase [Deltaproteobacteria bacterium]|nr:MAG: acyltransferase [Deltaproteobacteria bacterium]